MKRQETHDQDPKVQALRTALAAMPAGRQGNMMASDDVLKALADLRALTAAAVDGQVI